jgi:type IV secretory pathway VirB10-like protein
MAERRKIIIETGAKDAPLSTPHFDTEATLTARPVVPLSDQETYQTNYGAHAGHATKPFWKRPALLVPLVLVAIGIGVVAGLAIGIYRSRNAAQTPVATAPTPVAENTDLSQKTEPPTPPAAPTPTPQERVTAPAKPEEEPAVAPKDEPKAEERERRTTRNERKDNDDDEARQPVVAKSPVVREKKSIKVDEYIIEDGRAEDRQAEKEQRREERRAERRERRRRQREDDINVPREIERGGRDVQRIREIFEGRQP